MALITHDEIVGLPDDPELAFIKFEEICARRVSDIEDQLGPNEAADGAYVEYVSRVSAAARAYEISDSIQLPTVSFSGFVYSKYAEFKYAVMKIITGLQIRSTRRLRSASVPILENDRQKIEQYVTKLRERIDSSNLEEFKKKQLNKKLDELLAELRGKRLDLARVMLIWASVATLVNQTESAIIKLPDTISAVVEVIGWAHREELDRLPELPAPPKAIEHKTAESHSKEIFELDDEIPF